MRKGENDVRQTGVFRDENKKIQDWRKIAFKVKKARKKLNFKFE